MIHTHRDRNRKKESKGSWYKEIKRDRQEVEREK